MIRKLNIGRLSPVFTENQSKYLESAAISVVSRRAPRRRSASVRCNISSGCKWVGGEPVLQPAKVADPRDRPALQSLPTVER